MNKFLINILIAIAILTGCSNQKEHKGEVDIITGDTTGTNPDLTGDKAYDVQVSKVVLMGETYKITYYEKGTDALEAHGAFYNDSTANYNKAAYNWLCDTMVSIRLFNTETKKEVRFKVYGIGRRNGMITDN